MLWCIAVLHGAAACQKRVSTSGTAQTAQMCRKHAIGLPIQARFNINISMRYVQGQATTLAPAVTQLWVCIVMLGVTRGIIIIMPVPASLRNMCLYRRCLH